MKKQNTQEILNKTDNLIHFPDYKVLKNEVQESKEKLLMMILEQDELEYIECRNIETDYMKKLGSLECKMFKMEYVYLRLKRKNQLIRKKWKRQEEVIISEIETILDKEFAENLKKLDARLEEVNKVIASKRDTFLTEENLKELKECYRRIIEALHFDLNQAITSQQHQLYEMALVAYKKRDLQTIRTIDEIVVKMNIEIYHPTRPVELEKERKRLISRIQNTQKHIEEIKSNYPYRIKSIVENPRKMEICRVEMEGALVQYKEGINLYSQKIRKMIC